MPTPRPTLKRGRKIRAQIEQALHGLKDTVCDAFFYDIARTFLNMLLNLDNHDLARIFVSFDGVSEWPLSLWKKWKPCTLKTAAYLHWINGAPCPPKAAYDYLINEPRERRIYFYRSERPEHPSKVYCPNCLQLHLDFVFAIHGNAEAETFFRAILYGLFTDNICSGIDSIIFSAENGENRLTCYRRSVTKPYPGYTPGPVLRSQTEGYTIEMALSRAKTNFAPPLPISPAEIERTVRHSRKIRARYSL